MVLSPQWSCSWCISGVYPSPNQLFPYLPIDMILARLPWAGSMLILETGFLEIDRK